MAANMNEMMTMLQSIQAAQVSLQAQMVTREDHAKMANDVSVSVSNDLDAKQASEACSSTRRQIGSA